MPNISSTGLDGVNGSVSKESNETLTTSGWMKRCFRRATGHPTPEPDSRTSNAGGKRSHIFRRHGRPLACGRGRRQTPPEPRRSRVTSRDVLTNAPNCVDSASLEKNGAPFPPRGTPWGVSIGQRGRSVLVSVPLRDVEPRLKTRARACSPRPGEIARGMLAGMIGRGLTGPRGVFYHETIRVGACLTEFQSQRLFISDVTATGLAAALPMNGRVASGCPKRSPAGSHAPISFGPT